ncbi:MAG: SsrA-binding protein SmpB [Burkholderiaceae bacterium]
MSIVQNKKAFHEYFVEERFEAGIVLQGWEAKSIREGRAQLKEAYVVIRNAQVYLIGAHISPLISTSTHNLANPTRTRKLLLKMSEIEKLIGKTERSGYSLVPINLHFSKGRVKIDIGLAKGKKLHDKRQSIKDRDWKRQEQRILKEVNNPKKTVN